MKLILVISAVAALISGDSQCYHTSKQAATLPRKGCYKGKLEVKAQCMNYTIGIVSIDFDTSLVVANWHNEINNKTYKNVFALASHCNFPDTLKEGDEFFFKIDSTTAQQCMVCLIYYPVPSKKLSIKVVTTPFD